MTKTNISEKRRKMQTKNQTRGKKRDEQINKQGLLAVWVRSEKAVLSCVSYGSCGYTAVAILSDCCDTEASGILNFRIKGFRDGRAHHYVGGSVEAKNGVSS